MDRKQDRGETEREKLYLKNTLQKGIQTAMNEI